MKIHCYYLHKSKVSISEFPGIVNEYDIKGTEDFEYVFYAFTPDKISADFFETTRNMKLFYKKVIFMDRTIYEEEFYPENEERCIEEYQLITKVIENGIYKKGFITVLAPNSEIFMIKDFNPYLFEKYAFEYKLGTNYEIPGFNSNIFKNEEVRELVDLFCATDDDSTSLLTYGFDIDEYGLYIKMFFNTMKG